VHRPFAVYGEFGWNPADRRDVRPCEEPPQRSSGHRVCVHVATRFDYAVPHESSGCRRYGVCRRCLGLSLFGFPHDSDVWVHGTAGPSPSPWCPQSFAKAAHQHYEADHVVLESPVFCRSLACSCVAFCCVSDHHVSLCFHPGVSRTALQAASRQFNAIEVIPRSVLCPRCKKSHNAW
jgi:hypothetical protein